MPSQKQDKTNWNQTTYLSAFQQEKCQVSLLLLLGRREGPNICCAAAVLNIKDNRAAELESDKARAMFVSFSFSYLL